MNRKTSVLPLVALAGGFILSFVALGALWISTPWRYQMLMFLPFLALSYVTARASDAGGRDLLLLLIVAGATPIGALVVQFRDKDGSHLMPVLIVCAWVAGATLGRYLVRKPANRD
ncbi:MAG: lysophosphatidic acid receptor [Candidatus Levyibacteriota bacterium]